MNEAKHDYQEIRQMIEEERGKGAFIFLPSPIMDMKDSFFMPLAETVFLREDEVYSAQEKFRIHYNGLLRLAAAACIKWGVDNTRRTDNRSDKTYCSFMAVGGVLRADGSIQWHKAEKEIDLEVIEDELNDQYAATWEKVKDCSGNVAWKKKGHNSAETFIPAMVRRDLIQHRKNKLTRAESGAKARVIRSVLGIQGTYASKEQLIGMPFIMVHFAQNPNHPELKQHLLKALSSTQNLIYGSQQSQIGYYDKEIGSTDEDIIEMEPAEQPPDEKQDDDTTGFKGDANQSKFEPAPLEDNSPLIDFENSDISEQCAILENLCDQVDGESFSKYNKDFEKHGGIKGLDQTWRSEFFQYLIEKKDGKK